MNTRDRSVNGFLENIISGNIRNKKINQ